MSTLSATLYYEQIHSLYADIKSAYERLNRLQSRLDRQISKYISRVGTV
ncbi:hypothetical protein [Paenibacillus vulneris]|uniref:Uncharacterized protein n=1 Tax=Paenibacillus vulneris TaxID=1133364 RepID=A0ABW3UTZ3_9BACL